MLEAQGLIRQCGEFDSDSPGRRVTLWDIIDGQGDQVHPFQSGED
jgi:hypothetical protein